MTDVQWQIPPSMPRLLERAPSDRAVVVLLRHSVRDDLPKNDAGKFFPITEVGRRLALELGGVIGSRLCTLHASPFSRCTQTADALAEGAKVPLSVVRDQRLGDPGVFTLNEKVARRNWKRLGSEGVIRHLVTESEPLPGMASPPEAAHALVTHMLAVAGSDVGFHVFVTHDLLVAATVSWSLGVPLEKDCWPGYLEGAFFWQENGKTRVGYRDHRK